ncbi:hypothetical protein PVAND_008761 [Polypedilum vanderplanki]|uniref:Uncharacterized protein n=1 Tax=Polypedilum vanderplanki TaxID=319348 RepID=A0A9J6CBR3_POLVA|nr:hypothetical protein PVAND_008761 [Polypedilum vanderplanki]
MKKFCLLWCLILTLSQDFASGEPSKSNLWNDTNIDKLKSELLKNYDRFARPENHNSVTNLSVGITVIHMDLIESKGILETHAWLKLRWNDGKFKWDPKAYDNITMIHMAADEVWQPDLTVYNSAEATLVDHFAKTNKLIYSDGSVLWVPTSKFETYCTMNLKMWPFDEQNCEIKLGSWTYNAYQLNLFLDKEKPAETDHFHHVEWDLLKVTGERHEKYYSCCPEPYPDITFYLQFRRRSPMFKAIAVVPAAVIVFMTLTAFWLPPQSGEKLLLNGLACVIICILLVYFSQLLPIFSAGSPLIVTFYSNTLYLLCISFIISVIVINMSRNRKRSPVPKSIKSFFLDGFIGGIFGGKQGDTVADSQAEELKESEDHHIIQMTATSPKIHNEWIRLAIVIDRLAFVIYIIVFILMGFLHFV